MRKLATFLLFLSIDASAAVTTTDHVQPFIESYNKLTDKSPKALLRLGIDYEKGRTKVLEEVFYRRFSDKERAEFVKTFEVSLEGLPAKVAEYPKKIAEIKEIAAEVDKRFQQLFGTNLDSEMHIFWAMIGTDGKGTAPNGELGFSINLRVVADYSKEDLEILLAHELFHNFQRTREGSVHGISATLFSEGWATYASSLIFPGRPDWKYISYSRQDDRQYKKFQSQQSEVAKGLGADLESTQRDTVLKYFSGSKKDSGSWEPRSGYYMGYLLAKEFAKSRSPKNVAMMRYREFEATVRSELKKLE